MAEAVRPNGRVVGVDVDERCVALARVEALRLGLDVAFRLGAATTLQETSAYDLVFGRFVLTHVREPDESLRRMVAAARPGGVVVAEDIQFTGHFAHPACAAFDRYVGLYQEVVRRNGGDPNLGPRLAGLFLDAGLEGVDLEVVQPTFREGPGKHMAAVTMAHIREAVAGSGLASEGEIDGIVRELDAFARDPRTLLSWPRIFQVWGKRPT
jgi:hypothetical protein